MLDDRLIGTDIAFLSLLDRIPIAARAGRTTLLTGETGSGKDVIAQRMHRLSPRAGKPFVVVHCGALPENLVEAELFGYRRGAFTGATESRSGLIRSAGDGTLFLDEVNSLSGATQARLLRFLETGEYRPLGSDRAEHSAAWIIGATNQDLTELALRGVFRPDLVYRLAAVSFRVPALRERGDDVLLLADHFLRNVGPQLRFSAGARVALRAWPWPGNVRELKHRVESAALFATATVIEADLLGLGRPATASQVHVGPTDNPGTLTERLWDLIDTHGLTLAAAVEHCEQLLIGEGLRRSRNNRTRAAASLGIHLRTLYKKLPAAPASPCPPGHDHVYTAGPTLAPSSGALSGTTGISR
jgi:DNA-binding NtrC family response regulator